MRSVKRDGTMEGDEWRSRYSFLFKCFHGPAYPASGHQPVGGVRYEPEPEEGGFDIGGALGDGDDILFP